MLMLENWEQNTVPQLDPGSGGVPAGFEYLLRTAGVDGILYDNFQTRFNLDRGKSIYLPDANSFRTVGERITSVYPFVKFEVIEFKAEEGELKLSYVKNCLEGQCPVLMSLNLEPFGVTGVQITPVVGASRTHFYLHFGFVSEVINEVWVIEQAEIVRIHAAYDCGRDVVRLREPVPQRGVALRNR